MIKTLRRKFIFFAMAAVTILLVVLMVAINLFVWESFEKQATQVLNELIKTEGMFPKIPRKDNKPPVIPLHQMDIMRSARFFIAKADMEGNIIDYDLNQILYLDDESAVEYAKIAIDRNKPSGRIERYKYKIVSNDDYQKIYFLELTREWLSMRTILLVTATIAASSWVIVLIFVFLLSGKIVQPIINGLEKQKQFITNAGHELKTPLAVIQSNNDAMGLIYGENKYNRNIKSQVTRLNELTSNLLMQAKLDEEVELLKEQINVSELCKEILQPYQDNAAIHGISFQSQVTPDIVYNTNQQAFAQLLTILLDNAMKYTTENGEIIFSITKESKNLVICEENSCDPEMNINPENLFERFYRGDSARTQTDQKSGYGIGLSVARSICKSLGGEMTAYYPKQGRIRFIAKI